MGKLQSALLVREQHAQRLATPSNTPPPRSARDHGKGDHPAERRSVTSMV